MMVKRVYRIGQSYTNGMPNFVTYNDPSGWYKTAEGYKEYQANSFVCEGMPDYPIERWFVPDLYAPERGSTAIDEWDYYECSGTFGLFSNHALEVLTPFFEKRFVPIPVRFEGHPYYTLRCQIRLDCLDREASEIKYFAGSQDIMFIDKYAFRMPKLKKQMIFAVPKLFLHLFCTDGIPEAVADADLKGFEFDLVASK